MTNDEKQVLKAIGTMLLVKVAIYGSIAYAARSLRQANEAIDPDGAYAPIRYRKNTTAILGHTSTTDFDK